jgi:hypothetical protein
MNKFSPKSEFLKKRASSLHRSGYSTEEISRMLQICQTTAYTWLNSEFRKHKGTRGLYKPPLPFEPVGLLPTLAFVPHIKLTKNSKYTMRSV